MLAGLKTGKSVLSSRLGPAPRGLSGVLRPGGPWRGGRDHSGPKVEAPSSFCRILRVLESWKGRFSVPGRHRTGNNTIESWNKKISGLKDPGILRPKGPGRLFI